MRVQLLPEERDRARWSRFFACEAELRRHGIDFVDSSPDLVVANQRPWAERLRGRGLPAVIFQRYDAASVHGWYAEALRSREVLALFKNTVLRPPELHNASELRFHYELLATCSGQPGTGPARQPLAPGELAKIRCVLWDGYHSFLHFEGEDIFASAPDFDAPRPIDLHMVVGRVPAPPRRRFWQRRPAPGPARKVHHWEWHRARAQEEIAKLRPLRRFVSGIHDPNVPRERYREALRQAKICVSPWGYGEFCHRDLEAMLCGALLIKPDTDFVETLPDLYRKGETYLACRPDFADLAEQVDYALSHWDALREMRRANRERLVRCELREPARWAKHVAGELTQVFEAALRG